MKKESLVSAKPTIVEAAKHGQGAAVSTLVERSLKAKIRSRLGEEKKRVGADLLVDYIGEASLKLKKEGYDWNQFKPVTEEEDEEEDDDSSSKQKKNIRASYNLNSPAGRRASEKVKKEGYDWKKFEPVNEDETISDNDSASRQKANVTLRYTNQESPSVDNKKSDIKLDMKEETTSTDAHPTLKSHGFTPSHTNSSKNQRAHTTTFVHPKGHEVHVGHDSNGTTNNWVSRPVGKKPVFGAGVSNLTKHIKSLKSGK